MMLAVLLGGIRAWKTFNKNMLCSSYRPGTRLGAGQAEGTGSPRGDERVLAGWGD